MDEDDVLAGVPDDAEIQEESALLDEMDADAQDEVAEVGRFSGKKKDRKKGKKREGGEEEMEEEEVGGTPSSLPKKVGKRKIIQHSWPAEGPLALVPFGIDPDSAEEKAKREARAAKFGGVAEAAPQHSEEERARREERAAKFGLQASVSAAEKAAEGMVMPAVPEAPPEMQMLSAEDLKQREERAAKWGTTPANPLDSIVGAAPKGAFWEKRRDTAEDEVPRPEAVHIFGVDKLSTEDLLRFWVAEGVPVPTCVEWVNDSSANVVFASAEDAAAAVPARTVPLTPGQEAVDPVAWRTLPLHLAAAGKGLQLLFRLATYKDIKPPKRAPSRWYGEETKKDMKKHGSGGKGGKLNGRVEKRGGRKATPYDRGGGGRNTLAGKAGDAVSREMGGDLRSRMGGKLGAFKAEVGDDLRARIAAGRQEPGAGASEGAGFSYADFKRRRSEKTAGEEEEEEEDMGQGPNAAEVFDLRDRLAEGAGGEAPTGLFSLAAAKRDLGLKAEGAGAATVDDSEAGVGVAPAEGEAGEGGMDVEL